MNVGINHRTKRRKLEKLFSKRKKTLSKKMVCDKLKIKVWKYLCCIQKRQISIIICGKKDGKNTIFLWLDHGLYFAKKNQIEQKTYLAFLLLRQANDFWHYLYSKCTTSERTVWRKKITSSALLKLNNIVEVCCMPPKASSLFRVKSRENRYGFSFVMCWWYARNRIPFFFRFDLCKFCKQAQFAAHLANGES